MFKKVALILALFVCTSFAQKEGPFVGAGSKAILFSFGGLSNMAANNFDGGAGIKFFLASPMAIRVGVQANVSGTTTPANPVAPQVGMDGSTSSTTIGVEGALEVHLTTTRLTPYLGGGVGFSLTSNESKPSVAGTAPIYQTTTKSGGTSINFFVMMGAEYFVVDQISLAAEYRLGYSLFSPKDTEVSSTNPAVPTVTTKGTSNHSLSLNSTGLLTLAVYF
jgi:opacity protein-like surface antigen